MATCRIQTARLVLEWSRKGAMLATNVAVEKEGLLRESDPAWAGSAVAVPRAACPGFR